MARSESEEKSVATRIFFNAIRVVGLVRVVMGVLL
jgi:hypothetical protein